MEVLHDEQYLPTFKKSTAAALYYRGQYANKGIKVRGSSLALRSPLRRFGTMLDSRPLPYSDIALRIWKPIPFYLGTISALSSGPPISLAFRNVVAFTNLSSVYSPHCRRCVRCRASIITFYGLMRILWGSLSR